jgi:hypothetical protein
MIRLLCGHQQWIAVKTIQKFRRGSVNIGSVTGEAQAERIGIARLEAEREEVERTEAERVHSEPYLIQNHTTVITAIQQKRHSIHYHHHHHYQYYL